MTLSAHLTLDELACKDGTPYPAEWVTSRAVPLAAAFEAIRSACGDTPITVNSAYRTPAHNVAIGGKPDSQHVQGRALDLQPPAGLSLSAFYRIVRRVQDEHPGLGIKGIGRYARFVHIDIRPSDRLVLWSGDRAAEAA